MRSISLAIDTFLYGGKWIVQNLFSEIWLWITSTTLFLFEFYVNLILTVYNIYRPFLVDLPLLSIFNQLICTIYGYAFAIPVALISTVYIFLPTFARPYYTKPTDCNVPIPKTPPKVLLDKDKDYGEPCFVKLKNIKLHYVDKKPTDPFHRNHLYVFLHGFPGFWFSWRNQIKYFSKHNRTVAVDLRGFGLSDKPLDRKSYCLESLVEDLKYLLDEINPEKLNVVLVGHGWGGLIIYEFLLRYPKYVYKYITISAPPLFALEITSLQIVRFWTAYFYLLPKLPELYLVSDNLKIFDKIYDSESEDIVAAYKYVYGKSGSFTYGLNYFRANFRKLLLYTVFGYKLPKNTDFPEGLALYSDGDTFIDPDVYETISLKIPNLKTEELRGDHNPHEDIYRVDFFNRAVQYFVNGETDLVVSLQQTSYRFIDTEAGKKKEEDDYVPEKID